MYTCDHCRDLIWEDQFGLLEAGDRELVHQHLATCAACQAELAQAIHDQSYEAPKQTTAEALQARRETGAQVLFVGLTGLTGPVAGSSPTYHVLATDLNQAPVKVHGQARLLDSDGRLIAAANN